MGPSPVVNNKHNVIPNLTWDLFIFLNGEVQNQVRHDSVFHANKGFTLIELLVVVLIIGILASIALPQYQKAVEKSKATQALTLLNSLGQAQTAYRLSSGQAAEKFEELGVEIPFTGNTPWRTVDSNITDTRSNADWSFQLWKQNTGSSNRMIMAGRISGPYKGGGFVLYVDGPLEGSLRCVERSGLGITLSGEPGRYCKRFFGGTLLGTESATLREYKLPQ